MPGAMGSTANDNNTVTMMMAGAITKTVLSANGGIQSSFVKILIMSATTCRSPNGPDAIRAVAVLPERQQPAFHPDEQRREAERHNQDAEQSTQMG